MIQTAFIFTIIVGLLLSSSFAVEVTVHVQPSTHVIEHQATWFMYNYSRSLPESTNPIYCRWSNLTNGEKDFMGSYQGGSGNLVGVYREKMSIDKSGNIVLNTATRADAGTYECEVQISDDDPFITYEIVNITVLYLDAPTISLPKIVVDGDVLKIIVCYSGAANPDPILTIYKDDKPIASMNGTTLNYTISNATNDDTGDYYCKASNEAGNKDSDIKRLNIHYIDCQEKVGSNSTVVEGNTLLISCEVNAYPNANYTILYKDDKAIKSEVGNVVAHTINKVKQENAGNYYCMATNIAGTVTCGKRSVFVTYCLIRTFIFEEGFITCIAEGYPEPNTTIIVNGDDVSSGKTISTYYYNMTNPCNLSLIIECVADNGYGQKSERLQHCEGSTPKPMSTGGLPTAKNVKIVGMVLAISITFIIILVLVLILIVWRGCKRKRTTDKQTNQIRLSSQPLVVT